MSQMTFATTILQNPVADYKTCTIKNDARLRVAGDHQVKPLELAFHDPPLPLISPFASPSLTARSAWFSNGYLDGMTKVDEQANGIANGRTCHITNKYSAKYLARRRTGSIASSSTLSWLPLKI